MEYKSPTDVLTFELDWVAEISGSTITGTPVWTVQNGLTQDAITNTDTTSTIKLSGGTLGNVYQVQCRITTVAGDTFEKEFHVRVRRQLIG